MEIILNIIGFGVLIYLLIYVLSQLVVKQMDERLFENKEELESKIKELELEVAYWKSLFYHFKQENKNKEDEA